MDKKYVVITDNEFSQPMSRHSAINIVKDYDEKGISSHIVSEEEASRIGSPENFNDPKWE
ncbi:hypothetical protein [Senegalia massiliensis]|uniref:hypothetical protein n=1 Tax=Senegalia massiliensis TaxID=1720316 RepID=UPI0010327192|nr:hypothetical protein [Senegalia massiliensis]